VFDYRHVAAHVDSRFPVYGLHSVRRLVTQGMPATLHEMAEAHVAELLENGICNVPFLLYGVSGGGYLAIEIAIQLQRRGIEPLAVVLGDTRDFAAQRGPVDDHLQERYLWLSFVAAYLPAPLLEAMLSPGGEGLWAEKGDEARALFLIERTKVLGDQTFALPLDAAIFVRHLSDHRTYMRAYSSHRPRSYGGRSVYVKATRIGWEFSSEIRSCLSAHSVVEISGNHWALVDERGGGIVAGILGEEMQQARTRPVRATRAVN
jgi:thioesterase domain-containing protein